jgi:hypothetical protein
VCDDADEGLIFEVYDNHFRYAPYVVSGWIKAASGAARLEHNDRTNSYETVEAAVSSDSWTRVLTTFFGTSESGYSFYRFLSDGGACTAYLDGGYAGLLYELSCYAPIEASTSDVLMEVELTVEHHTQAGFVLCIDSVIATPAYCIWVYYDARDGHLHASKRTWDVNRRTEITSLLDQAVSYGDGKKLKVIKRGTTLQVFYDGSQVGTDQTVSGAGIVDNTIHGLFSTWEGNAFDNFYMFALGYDGEYDTALNAILP